MISGDGAGHDADRSRTAAGLKHRLTVAVPEIRMEEKWNFQGNCMSGSIAAPTDGNIRFIAKPYNSHLPVKYRHKVRGLQSAGREWDAPTVKNIMHAS